MTEEKQKEPASASSSAKASGETRGDSPKASAPSAGKQELNIEELKKKLEECEKLKNEYLTGWQRERADFLNYKRDEWERLEGILKFAGEGLILKILPILDNFEIVTKKLPEDLKSNENVKGLLQIKAQLQNFIKSQGVEEIESLGKKFDPNLMEIFEVVAKSGVNSGIVIEEIQKGYKIHGKVLRPARVKISK